MDFKRGDYASQVFAKRRYFKLIVAVIVIILVLILVGIYFLFLTARFSIGDYIISKDTGKVGQVKGISFMQAGYLIYYPSTDLYTTEPFWNLQSLSDLQNYKILDIERNLTIGNSKDFFPDFKSEDNFNDYLISRDSSNQTSSLIYKNSLITFNYSAKKDCSPKFICSGWGICHAEYTIDMIVSNQPIQGISYRYCKDENKCFPDIVDSEKCENKMNITTRVTRWCNSDYLEVVDGYGRVLSRLKNTNIKSGLDISLNMMDKGYCYYCYDGKKDFDETSKDCGGSCISCAELKKFNSQVLV